MCQHAIYFLIAAINTVKTINRSKALIAMIVVCMFVSFLLIAKISSGFIESGSCNIGVH